VSERELLDAAVDALNRADVSSFCATAHPEIVYHPIRSAVTGDYHGHRGLEKFIRDNTETFDIFEVGIDETTMLDDGRMFVAGRVRVRGIGGRVDAVVETAGYLRFRDGLISEWHDYGDRATARAALGLT
jgi:ketosteroid isomerase-like protein